jgi:hypothetical protein
MRDGPNTGPSENEQQQQLWPVRQGFDGTGSVSDNAVNLYLNGTGYESRAGYQQFSDFSVYQGEFRDIVSNMPRYFPSK